MHVQHANGTTYLTVVNFLVQDDNQDSWFMTKTAVLRPELT